MNSVVETIKKCEAIIGRPIELDQQARRGLEFFDDYPDNSLPAIPVEQIRTEIVGLNPLARFGSEYNDVGSYDEAFTLVIRLAQAIFESEERDQIDSSKLADYAINAAEQMVRPAVDMNVFYGTTVGSCTAAIRCLRKIDALNQDHLSDLLSKLADCVVKDQYERANRFYIAAELVEPLVDPPLQGLALSPELLEQLEGILGDGGKAILLKDIEEETRRPAENADLYVKLAFGLVRFLQTNGVKLQEQTLVKLSQGITEVIRAEAEWCKGDIEFSSMGGVPPVQSHLPGFVTAVAALAQKVPVTIAGESFGCIGKWYTEMIRGESPRVAKSLSAAKQIGVPLEEQEIANVLNDWLKDEESMPGVRAERIIDIAVDSIKAGLSINLSDLKATVTEAIIKGDSVFPKKLCADLLADQVISPQEIAEAVVKSRKSHEYLVKEVLEQRPDLAEFMLFQKQGVMELDYLEVIMEAEPQIADKERFAELCDRMIPSALGKFA